MSNYNLVVVGAGPGGYVAAIRAAQLGMKACVVEATHLGGICLNWGCIPTKALLRTAEVYHTITHAEEYGITVKDAKIDISKIVKRSRDVSGKLSGGIKALLKKNKVDVIDGFAKFKDSKTLEISVDGKVTQTLSCKNIILATGARAKVIPGYEPDGKLVWTYREAMVPETMPKSIVVIGSGAIGIEFASFYLNLGAEVTLLEVAPRILINEDKEIADFARKSFEKQGMKIVTSANLKGLKKGSKDVTINYEADGKAASVTADRIIMAVGISPNTDKIAIEKTKIKLDAKGHVITNDYMQTEEPHIYAIGDVAGAPWLAHKASHEGIIAVEKIAGKNPHKMNKLNIPGCTYSRPQIASVGITEEKAKELKYDIKVGRFPFFGNGKAIALGEPEGLVKTIFDSKTGELLGAHMVGAEVTEMIQGYVIAKNMEGTEEDLMHTVFPHPTLSEMMHESVLDAYKKAIHI
ncbi:MAG: dihydrolipoyl dehydrogenase [Alphaproteobacteria bacterium]|nr:dihydrolipoyl dehydrogenase [Alphaproteobacteria bacterium]OJV16353.1 MAG: dihydrolipoyl dehydrogenase [Alphaproteobacteria bacterium 33-17]